MGKGTAVATRPLKKVHSTAKKAMGWVVYVLAIADATLLVATFVADWYRKFMHMFPAPWRIGIVLIVGVVMVILAFIDVINDLWPNLTAVFCTLLLPTVISPLSGGFAQWIQGGADWVFGLVDQWLAKANPDGVGVGNDLWAIALLVAVVMLAQRFNKKGA